MTHSESIAKIGEALSKAQAEYPSIQKKREAGGGTAFKYRYAALGDYLPGVLDVLSRHGLALSQGVETQPDNGGKIQITTLLMHAGEWISAQFVFPVAATGKMNVMQTIGSSITYGKRYAIDAILGLSSEDDTDAQGDELEQSDEKEKSKETGVLVPLVQQIRDILDCGLFLEVQKKAAHDALNRINPEDVTSLLNFRKLWERKRDEAVAAKKKVLAPLEKIAAKSEAPGAAQPQEIF